VKVIDVFHAIQARREITKYKDTKVADDILTKVVDAGVFALRVITCHPKI
jgi:hypothetical protein